ncbi:Protein kinase of the Mitotic Exit Network [Rhodotorula sphaerocarpa]
MAHHGESVSLILPGASAKASPGGVATPPRLLRANTVVMHPAAVPLDIDLRGRLVRARNLHTGSASPGLTISSTSSSGRDEPPFDLEQSDHSLDSHTPADSLVDHIDGLPRPGMYGNFDKRAVQSAIDVLAVVDEDQPNSTAPANRPKPHRHFVRHLGVKSAAEKIRLCVCLASGGHRSFSSGIITEPTVAEREEHGVPTVSAPDLTLTAPSPGLSETGPAGAGLSETRRARKRVLSDPALDTLLPTRQCPGTPIGRTPRRGSLSSVAREGSSEEVSLVDARLARRSSSGPTVRTKLVEREKGQPVLTYQLGECIGRGQFGSVYRALNLNTGQVVAVKRIALDGRSKDEVAQLSQEVMLLQSLSHPAVVKYEGVVRTQHFLNIILEFVENGSLQRTLKQFGELPEALVASYVDKILEGLIYLHAQGVVHCDLKAANVLSTKNGNVKLSDFGVSLNLHAIKTTRGLAAGANDANGTPNWMAPEVISLEGATPASDIWSLGATVCELVSGKPPYHDLTSMSAMFRIVEDDFPPLPHGASSRLRDFLRRCFHKKPDGRPLAIALYDDPWLVQFRAEEKNSLERDGLETSAAKKPHPLSEAPVTDAPFCDSPRPTLELQDQSFEIGAAAEHSRPHDFVKITSSKAVECRLCGEQTKRHAVLCKNCGLISHSRCREFAPGCDLHAQLTLQRIPTLPSRPQSGESTFSLADYNPFGRNRRSRQSSHRSSGEFSTAASQSISPIRALSGVLHPHGKQRSPASSPPTSLGKAAAVAGPRRSLSPPPKQRTDTPATPTRPPLVRSPRISIDEPRVPLRQAAFAAADGEHATRASPIRDPSRRRTFSAQYSHGRSVSQPSFPVPENSAKRSDCRAM